MSKCPMLKTRYKVQQFVEPPDQMPKGIAPRTKEIEIAEFQDCIGEECAWWDEDNRQCCIMSISYWTGVEGRKEMISVWVDRCTNSILVKEE